MALKGLMGSIVVGMSGLCLTTGCSAVMSSATARLSGSLGAAVMEHNDPETVRQGAPAYLLLIDGLVAQDPDNSSTLLTAARLYSSYAGAFVADEARARRLAESGRDYGWRGLCEQEPRMCGVWNRPFEEFERIVRSLGPKTVPALFDCGSAWATWIQAHRSDWSAVADKARVEEMMRRVIALDERYEQGAAHLYLGVLATLLPEALGGRPEDGRAHFERATELSNGRNLMARVLLAREYARLVFDRELHDRLCREVIAADAEAPGLTLSNVLAQEEAERLLADSADYFGE